ncbi:MAG: redox-regulated ATPase YchF [Candidatus Bathyarchaeia archaeon]
MKRLVGIVGKPNVGKSTFFSAATLVPVAIANYPFTTIKPNRGIAYVKTKCVCKELKVKDNPVNSVCIDGTRLVPVELIDCAGLVPGSWKGRGLGNQFLDEVRRADALIHIVDVAGATDIEGKVCKPGLHDPLEDVEFLEKEIDMWIFQMLKEDWERISRRVEISGEKLEEILEERLSGLGIKKTYIIAAIRECGLSSNKPSSWNDDEFLNFIDRLRGASKPMLIAANKIDLPFAKENIEKLRGKGCRVVPCCAEAELALRRSSEKGLTDYTPGNSDFKIIKPELLTTEQKKALEDIKQKVLIPYGSTGVQQAIDLSFFELLNMIVVYPVEDVEKLSDHKGRVLPDAYLVPSGTTVKEFAYTIHTELGEGFLYAIDARSKLRLKDDYALKDRDIISIVSAKKRG